MAAGLLGTERRLPDVPATDGALANLLAGAAAQPVTAEQRWLAGAAALGQYRRAGKRPIVLPPSAIPPAPGDATPTCSALAGEHLAALLAGPQAEVLAEWLAAAAQAGRRVPPESVPALLDAGRARVALRPAVAAVIGQLGQWLAAQNPDWEYAALSLTGAEDMPQLVQHWETSTRPQRLALLARLRAQRPADALALLSATWHQEHADDRAAFVVALAAGLSSLDEAFLEATLDDRARSVRQAAAELLARLPGSLLAERMAARLRPLVGLTRGWRPRRVKRFTLALPEACDDAMQRDGVVSRPRGARGEKAWWLLQLVAAAPLQFWTGVLEAAPLDCVRLTAGLEWRGLLLEGWAEAASRQCAADPAVADWAEALLAALLEQEPPEPINLGPLLLALPAARREAFILRRLVEEPGLDAGRPAFRLLTAIREPWGRDLSQRVLPLLADQIASNRSTNPAPLLGLLDQAAFCALAAAGVEAAPRLLAAAGAQPFWPAAVERFVSVVRFRHAMLRELTP
jgi:hypothetical protein